MVSSNPEKKPAVLVVDDDPIACALLKEQLTESGFPFLCAHHGNEAIQIARLRRPKMVILNWLLPELNGPDVFRELRSMQVPPPYVISLIEHSTKHHMLEALDAGADDYLNKPLNAAEVFARLRAGLRSVRLQRSFAARVHVGQRMAVRLATLSGQLRALESADDLTGLLNRRRGIERLDEEWHLAVRYDHPLACAMIDIDNFKQMNEALGQVGADVLLRKVGDILRSTARDTDMVIRYAGGAFLVIMPYQAEAAAALAGERYRAAVQAAADHATISVGVASRSADSATPERILRHAEAALQAAKRRGKNCVLQASDVLRQPFAA